uniref:Uncharacterized protein n=1 Tax=Mycena chlorophos TaxID=658473 RepID=A0ABQ0MDJ9_MYCCL|nr:predicted protein [Mycena chlorophos]
MSTCVTNSAGNPPSDAPGSNPASTEGTDGKAGKGKGRKGSKKNDKVLHRILSTFLTHTIMQDTPADRLICNPQYPATPMSAETFIENLGFPAPCKIPAGPTAGRPIKLTKDQQRALRKDISLGQNMAGLEGLAPDRDIQDKQKA